MSDSEIFFYFIVVPCVLLFLYFRIFRSQQQKPVQSVIQLPQKIQISKETDNNYGVGTFLLDVVTIGGHGRFKTAMHGYENVYRTYASHFNTSIDSRYAIHNSLNALGDLTYKIILELDKSQRILNRKSSGGMDAATINQLHTASQHIMQLKELSIEKQNTNIVLLQGSAVGGLAAIGSWTFVSMFGAASTGTSIATLSGVAAHNATLAWFGGGALAAGGGGMAAGAMTLAGIVALPIILFSSYKTHTKADEVEKQTSKLAEENVKLKDTNKNLVSMKNVLTGQEQTLKNYYDKLVKFNEHTYKLIYPYGILSQVTRSFQSFMDQDFYTQDEAQTLDHLGNLVEEIYTLFDRGEVEEQLYLDAK